MFVARHQVNEQLLIAFDRLLAELLGSVRRTVTCLRWAGLVGG